MLSFLNSVDVVLNGIAHFLQHSVMLDLWTLWLLCLSFIFFFNLIF